MVVLVVCGGRGIHESRLTFPDYSLLPCIILKVLCRHIWVLSRTVSITIVNKIKNIMCNSGFNMCLQS